MKLYLEGHDFEFATQQIYMCMFPNSHAEFVPEKPDSGDFIISSLTRGSDEVISETKITIDGREVSESASSPLWDGISDEDTKRQIRRAIKTSFYKAAVCYLPKAPVWGALTGIRPSKVAAKYLDDGFSALDAEKAMTDEYFVSPERARLAVACAERAKFVAANTENRDFSLYVGIPFCASRCRYCSFVSHSIEKARGLVTPYLEMLIYELSTLGKAVKEAGLNLRSVYIGGGTPTALSRDELELVMREISKNFDVENALEYTVEGGRPDTLTYDKIETIKNLGASRISVNPQTMNDDILEAMDRRHTAADVVRTIENVRKIGGLAINMDLIAGLPGDNLESFSDSVDRVLSLSPENVTVHTLAIKKGSTLSNEKYKLPDGDETERMVEYSMRRILGNGYVPYYLYRQKYMSGNLENVGYAHPGFENLYNNYIMDELHTIISAGAGGVTKLIDSEKGKIERIFNLKYPYEYNNSREKIDSTKERIKEFFEE